MPPAYLVRTASGRVVLLDPALADWRPVIAGSGTSRQQAGLTAAVMSDHTAARLKRQHFLYFLPLPHGHGSLRPVLALRAGLGGAGAPLASACPAKSRAFLRRPGSPPTRPSHPAAPPRAR